MSAWDKDNTIGQRCILELALKYTKAQHDLLDKTFRVQQRLCCIGFDNTNNVRSTDIWGNIYKYVATICWIRHFGLPMI